MELWALQSFGVTTVIALPPKEDSLIFVTMRILVYRLGYRDVQGLTDIKGQIHGEPCNKYCFVFDSESNWQSMQIMKYRRNMRIPFSIYGRQNSGHNVIH